MVRMWMHPEKTLPSKRGPFGALQKGSQEVKADCRDFEDPRQSSNSDPGHNYQTEHHGSESSVAMLAQAPRPCFGADPQPRTRQHLVQDGFWRSNRGKAAMQEAANKAEERNFAEQDDAAATKSKKRLAARDGGTGSTSCRKCTPPREVDAGERSDDEYFGRCLGMCIAAVVNSYRTMIVVTTNTWASGLPVVPEFDVARLRAHSVYVLVGTPLRQL